MSIQYDSISYAAYVKDGKVTYEAIYQDAGRIVYTLTITERDYVNIITSLEEAEAKEAAALR